MSITLAGGVVVHGRVLDEKRKPAKGADVWVIAEHWDSFTVAGDDGAFTLPPLPLEKVRLSATRDLGERSRPADLEFRRDERERDVELVLEKPIEAGRLQGRLVGLDGLPAGIERELLPRMRPWELEDSHSAPRIVGLDSDSEPVVGGTVVRWGDPAQELDPAMREDRYELAWQPSMRWIALVAREEVLGVAAVPAGPPFRGDGPDLVVDLSKLPPEPTRGRLRVLLRERGSGAVIRESCEAVAHVYDRGRWDADASAHTVDGEALLQSVGAGDATVIGSSDGWMPTAGFLTTHPSEEPQSIVLELARADARIRGEVVAPDGGAIADAEVELFVSVGDGLQDVPLAPQSTSADGCFTFDGLATGSFVAIVRADGFAPSCVDLRADVEGAPRRIVLARGSAVRFRLVLPNAARWPRILLRISDRRGTPLVQDWAWQPFHRSRIDRPRPESFVLTLPQGEFTCEAISDGTEPWRARSAWPMARRS